MEGLEVHKFTWLDHLYDSGFLLFYLRNHCIIKLCSNILRNKKHAMV